MMKYSFLLAFAAVLLSCRNDVQDIQSIDQIVMVFIKDKSGKDLLNNKISGSYQSVSLYDLGGLRDQIPINTFALKKTSDTATFLEYTAGARRNLLDSVSPENKSYRSDILVKLQKKEATDIDLDTLTIFYKWTPQLFQVSKINYNKAAVFYKKDGVPNSFTVIR